MNVFKTIAAETWGLRKPYPIRDAAVALRAIPPHLLPPDFNSESQTLPQTYLDSAASTKMIGPARETWALAQENYANTHSDTYAAAEISNQDYEKARGIVHRFLNAPADHGVVFVGNGTTAAVNRLARTLFAERPQDRRRKVVVPEMEHHANLLPWQKHTEIIPIPIDRDWGTLPLDRLKDILEKNRDEIRLVAVTGVSNVTGVVNDIAEIARLSHAIGAEIFVDAAQMAAHRRIDMSGDKIDYLALSGHKAYAPGSPGVLVMPRSASRAVPDEMGGGIVLSVDLDHFLLSDQFPAREEAGTPNIVGGITLASALETLEKIGMDQVWEHERQLVDQLLEGLSAFRGVTIYGDTDTLRTPRAGVVAFSVEDIPHPIAARALSHYFGIAVRNECFCAHPHVKALRKMSSEAIAEFERSVRSGDRSRSPGMVRVSLGLYTLPEDIEYFHAAGAWIVSNRDRLLEEYEVTREGKAVRRDGWRIKVEEHQIFKT